MVKNKGITAGEFIYGLASLIFGFPTVEGALSKEILSTTTGSLHIVLAILFGIWFVTGIIALIDFILRLFESTFADEINKIIEKNNDD